MGARCSLFEIARLEAVLEARERLVDKARNLVIVRQLAAIGGDNLSKRNCCSDGGWKGDIVVFLYRILVGSGSRGFGLVMSVICRLV